MSDVMDKPGTLAGTLFDLTSAMESLAAGELDRAHARIDVVPVRVSSRDEIGAMASSFNTMQEEAARAGIKDILLVTGGQVGLLKTLVLCVVGGLFGAAAAIVVARARAEVESPAPAPPRPDLPAAIGPATRLEGAPERGRRSLLWR